MESPSQSITQLLSAWNKGDQQALDELIPLVYGELRRIARHQARRLPNQTLQPTELIHEAFAQLAEGRQIEWQDRAHFFAVCARMMRFILIDRLRRRQRYPTIPLDEVEITLPELEDDLLALDEALSRLESLDKQQSLIVEGIRGKRGLGALPNEPVSEQDLFDGKALRAALFDPLLPAIGNRKRLLLAPDGDLTRLPFEALPTDDGRHLIDDYQISYLGVGRDVLRFGAASSGQPTAALVAADPDFDLSSEQAHSQATSETAGVLQRGRVSRETQTADLENFERLPGTRVEGERIARMLGVKPLLDEEALEARIKACRSPRILHLATHGFFLADQRRDSNRELRGLGLLGGQAGDGFGQMSEMPSGRMSGPGMENPLLRSGVLLAGFKTWLKGGNLPAEAEDGLLTAEDVSGLDLLATELVVLSACETGLGEVRTGEGVFGLRRAFALAGAKTLVMSLWKVPDEQTQELMEDFYRRILRGEPRAEALRQAQLEIKKRYPDPFYWGAFICQGDPGPLPLQVTEGQEGDSSIPK